MSDLDKKLEAAYTYDFTPTVGGQKFETHVDVAAIKQAFIDDGWREPYVGPDTHPIDPKYTPEQLKAMSEVWSKPRMTGKEWYGKYNKEVERLIAGSDGLAVMGEVHRIAAKKAAGIDL